jgi:hypothetical protein
VRLGLDCKQLEVGVRLVRLKAARLAASKCSLLARVDAYGQHPSGEVRADASSLVHCVWDVWLLVWAAVCLGFELYAAQVWCMHRAYAAAPRLAASKCSLLARVDAYGQDPSGEVRADASSLVHCIWDVWLLVWAAVC